MSRPNLGKWETLVIFGGTSRIAQEVARKAAADNRRIIIVGRHVMRLELVRGDLLARGAPRVDAIACDLADIRQHEALWIELDVLLTEPAAYLLAYGTLGDQKVAESNVAYAVSELTTNLVSSVALLTVLGERLLSGGNGLIAVITSVAGDRARRSNYVYGMTKGGLSLFTQGLRARLHPHGIRVLTIKPGPVRTPMTRDLPGRSFADPRAVGQAIYSQLVTGHRDIMYTPWYWRWIMTVIRLLPETMAKRLNFLTVIVA